MFFFAESMSCNHKRCVSNNNNLTWLETHPSLWLSARLTCPWRSLVWWGTALPVYCPEVCQAANRKTDKQWFVQLKPLNLYQNIFSSFKSKPTFKVFRRWQQVHSTSFICLSQGMVRSLERAKETYQTWGPNERTDTETKITSKKCLVCGGYKHMHTHFRLIFNLHAGEDSTTELLKPLCDEHNYSHFSHTAQDEWTTRVMFTKVSTQVKITRNNIIMKVN